VCVEKYGYLFVERYCTASVTHETSYISKVYGVTIGLSSLVAVGIKFPFSLLKFSYV
jgi:hypothetical protein